MKRLIALCLACLLLMSGLVGCMGPGEDVGADEPVNVTDSNPEATPIPTPDVPVTPNVVVTTPKVDAKVREEEVNIEVHGDEEVMAMTEVSGSFAADGGPNFRLMVDKERYQVNDIGGYCYVTLRTGMSGDVYAELGFWSNTDAATLSNIILDEYGVMSTKQDLGDEVLGRNTVRHLRGETVQNVFDAYLLEANGGCVTMVLCTTAETGAHRARLMATLETLEIFS